MQMREGRKLYTTKLIIPREALWETFVFIWGSDTVMIYQINKLRSDVKEKPS